MLVSPQPPSIECQSFASIGKHAPIDRVRLVGHGGLALSCLSLGGIIQRIEVPSSRGTRIDCVVGFEDPHDYLSDHPFLGAVAGRVAGRIAGARFGIDGCEYRLEANDAPNCVHSGSAGFDKRVWTMDPGTNDAGEPFVELRCFSPAGDGGFPGNARVRIRYTVRASNSVVFEEEAWVDQPSPLSLTQHAYFNLNGTAATPIDNHVLTIPADRAFACDQQMCPTGERFAVEGTAADFRSPAPLRDRLKNLFHQHGDLYDFETNAPIADLAPRATITCDATGLGLRVASSHRCLQFYTGAHLDGQYRDRSGAPLVPFSAFCLECEEFPNAVNAPAFGQPYLLPGEGYHHVTEYQFFTL